MAYRPSPKQKRRLRRSVFRRDGFRCRDNCGIEVVPPPGWDGEGIPGLTLGHIIPQQMGGSWSVLNLITQCKRDNEELANQVWVGPRHHEASDPRVTGEETA